ncbi:HDIG domain-containing metalloprotein [uncultured Capnocytophaga sp.]|jgi:7TM-receptor with intracellular phosphohydrolase domain protein|uniref:HD family phosphohydrolase n=1 Tax=uncultured Capnocytophaga sp. TaxID=159273 RepID=UPI0026376BF1|nr:HDIG domain-containing metalloprotein [uncultured Capnocytophaga sp.]
MKIKYFWYKLYAKQNLLYKFLLAIIVMAVIVFLLPKENKFSYEFQAGKPWLHPSLYAPFDFTLKKTKEEIAKEKQFVEDQSITYFFKDTTVIVSVKKNYYQKALSYFASVDSAQQEKLLQKGEEFLKKAYRNGAFYSSQEITDKEVSLVEGNEVSVFSSTDFFFLNQLKESLYSFFKEKPFVEYIDTYYAIFSEVMLPNIFVNEYFTQKALDENLKKIVHSYGLIKKGQLIIEKGQLVTGDKLIMLTSLQKEYTLNSSDNITIISLIGYILVVAMLVSMVLLYLYHFKGEMFANNNIVTLIFVTILLFVGAVSWTASVNVDYISALPICVFPLVMKAFFDLRLGMFLYIITLILIGFIVPNSFQYIYTNAIVAGTLLVDTKGLHYRINLFLVITYIVIAYIITYLCHLMIATGTLDNIHYPTIGLFILNGFLILFVQPLTYLYEKIFGLVSNVSLLELSDTHNKLLRELAEKAPGSFQHSLQVSNLAEASALAIGANAMLVRVGALYHDIGKMKNPLYFTENQKTSVNPHDELTPIESAKIIKNHVIDGIELARQNNIPDRIIDFIRTHHGNSLIYYFYKKQLDSGEPFSEEDFRYSGPIPFSKETAILMMSDSVEAASKSLVNPDTEAISLLVENIIRKQIEEKQFLNADITFKDIEKIKKVLKEKLFNIYHLRIAYPK